MSSSSVTMRDLFGEDRRLPNGYVETWFPEHPLAHQGWVRVHRLNLYWHLGADDQPCHWCGWVLPWRHEGGFKFCINVDHLNAVRDDNRVENLVVSCWACNLSRAWEPVAPRTWERMVRETQHVPPWERQPTSWLAAELEART